MRALGSQWKIFYVWEMGTSFRYNTLVNAAMPSFLTIEMTAVLHQAWVDACRLHTDDYIVYSPTGRIAGAMPEVRDQFQTMRKIRPQQCQGVFSDNFFWSSSCRNKSSGWYTYRLMLIVGWWGAPLKSLLLIRA